MLARFQHHYGHLDRTKTTRVPHFLPVRCFHRMNLLWQVIRPRSFSPFLIAIFTEKHCFLRARMTTKLFQQKNGMVLVVVRFFNVGLSFGTPLHSIFSLFELGYLFHVPLHFRNLRGVSLLARGPNSYSFVNSWCQPKIARSASRCPGGSTTNQAPTETQISSRDLSRPRTALDIGSSSAGPSLRKMGLVSASARYSPTCATRLNYIVV